VVLFALTILIFALETISSPAFPEQGKRKPTAVCSH
jgi:hypothetical protein